MVSANTPAATASMIACRLLPLPDIRMTSFEGMVFLFFYFLFVGVGGGEGNGMLGLDR